MRRYCVFNFETTVIINYSELMEVSLTLPLGYNVPEIIQQSPPEVLAALLDCMEVVLNSFSVRLDSDVAIEKLKARHEHELVTMKDHFVQRLHEQKKQLLDEREEAVCIGIQHNIKTRNTEQELVKLKEQLNHCHVQNTLYATEQQRMREIYDTTISKFDDATNMFRALKTSPVHKGQFGENYVRTFLQNKFPSAEIRDQSQVSHAGDIVMTLNDTVIMIETKHKTHVTKEDLIKFENDIKNHDTEYNGAMFVTTSSGIPTKGEFAFEFIGKVPVIYISKFMDTPEILKFGTDLILSLIPVFETKESTEEAEYTEMDDLMEKLSLIVSTAYLTCESIRQNTKTLNIIIKHAKEQTQQNDDKLQWCTLEIEKHTERYRTKKNFRVQNTTTTQTNILSPDVKYVFEILRNAFISTDRSRQKFVYKTFVRDALSKGLFSDKYKTVESILKILPKTKFDDLMV